MKKTTAANTSTSAPKKMKQPPSEEEEVNVPSPTSDSSPVGESTPVRLITAERSLSLSPKPASEMGLAVVLRCQRLVCVCTGPSLDSRYELFFPNEEDCPALKNAVTGSVVAYTKIGSKGITFSDAPKGAAPDILPLTSRDIEEACSSQLGKVVRRRAIFLVTKVINATTKPNSPWRVLRGAFVNDDGPLVSREFSVRYPKGYPTEFDDEVKVGDSVVFLAFTVNKDEYGYFITCWCDRKNSSKEYELVKNNLLQYIQRADAPNSHKLKVEEIVEALQRQKNDLSSSSFQQGEVKSILA